jgi:hypothetical protein
VLWEDRGFLQVADGRRAYIHNSQCTNTDAKAVEKITADTPVLCLIAKPMRLDLSGSEKYILTENP